MERLDCYETARRIRNQPDPKAMELNPNPYIIAMTGSNVEGERQRCLAAEMNDYVTKSRYVPISPR